MSGGRHIAGYGRRHRPSYISEGSRYAGAGRLGPVVYKPRPAWRLVLEIAASVVAGAVAVMFVVSMIIVIAETA